ncbi:glycoside hydrolase N-terminal domain-containing protein [Actinoplanes sp. NPDC049802]|uniref:glycoside hydrolase N-terminal domain-containing protein n=1 Tax=Actinoplanes sp. NPDC049802 TaxID=3154742 RepID=UPI0033FB0567
MHRCLSDPESGWRGAGKLRASPAAPRSGSPGITVREWRTNMSEGTRGRVLTAGAIGAGAALLPTGWTAADRPGSAALPEVLAAENLAPWYDEPAGKDWPRMLPPGNGRLGAMVFGNVDTERLQLNEDTVRAGGPHDSANTRGRPTSPRSTGGSSRAQDLINQMMMGSPDGRLAGQPVGNLRLALGEGHQQPVAAPPDPGSDHSHGLRAQRGAPPPHNGSLAAGVSTTFGFTATVTGTNNPPAAITCCCPPCAPAGNHPCRSRRVGGPCSWPPRSSARSGRAGECPPERRPIPRPADRCGGAGRTHTPGESQAFACCAGRRCTDHRRHPRRRAAGRGRCARCRGRQGQGTAMSAVAAPASAARTGEAPMRRNVTAGALTSLYVIHNIRRHTNLLPASKLSGRPLVSAHKVAVGERKAPWCGGPDQCWTLP